MNICFLAKDYSFNGGGERMLCNLANNLGNDYEVTVVSLDKSDKSSIYILDSSIRYVNANIKRRKINFFTKFDYVKYLLYNKSFFDNFDVIIGVGIICNLVLAFCAPKLKSITIGWEHFCYDGTPLYQRVLRKFWFKRLTKVVVLTKKDLPKYLKINPNSIVIYNFTDMQFRKMPALDSKRFLFIGRLSKQKGFLNFLRIVKLFCDINSDWNFKIIGKGPYQKKLFDFISAEKLEHRIIYQEESCDIQAEMESSSCLLLTSKWEGLPMVLIEALTCGLPAISFDTITGPSDIINDGNTGFIVENYDMIQFVNRMLLFVSDKEKIWSFSKQSILESALFSIKVQLPQWKLLVEEEFYG